MSDSRTLVTSVTLVVTGALLVVTGALLVVTMFAVRNKKLVVSGKKHLRISGSLRLPCRSVCHRRL